MEALELREVRNYALRGVSLRVGAGELLLISGPNGAGKTTLLKCVAGLASYSGSILLDGRPLDEVPPERRGVGYVPQSAALFDHMRVWENVAYGLKVRGLHEGEVEKRVRKVLELMGVERLADRYPRTLSGGERQRVAIARALAVSPRILLLDEPFANLDAEGRETLRREIKKLHDEKRITILLTSHDPEALRLRARTAFMENGRVVRIIGGRGVV